MNDVQLEPDELCPPLLSEIIRKILEGKFPHPPKGPDPDPWKRKAITDIFASVAIHTLSFELQNQKLGQSLREQVSAGLSQSVEQFKATP